jgi:hypothetical protein
LLLSVYVGDSMRSIIIVSRDLEFVADLLYYELFK